jgi:carboxymethylenebutenolidase
MAPERIEIKTGDGSCPTYLFRAPGSAPLPAVLFFMDGIGIRPALFQMGERMAAGGYHVILPDLFYRAGPYEPMDAKTIFSDPEQRAMLMTRFMPVATIPLLMKDTGAFLEHLSGRKDVRQSKVGATGYCLGGRVCFAAAAHFPDRIVVAAAFHPSRLVTDDPDSLHLLAPRIKARVQVAAATEDQNFTPEQQKRLDEALTAAGVQHTVEMWPARHGWVPGDTPAHNPQQAERHWTTLLQLFDETLAR